MRAHHKNFRCGFTFLGVSSPSCASFALRRTATDNQDHFDEETVETVRKNFYVDDCLKSVQSEQDAVRLAGQLCDLLAKGGFRLTKWLSNSCRVIESVPVSERAGSVKNLDLAARVRLGRTVGRTVRCLSLQNRSRAQHLDPEDLETREFKLLKSVCSQMPKGKFRVL